MSKRKSFAFQAPIEAYIEKFSHDARGIARIDGKITFIDGALPGEHVMFQYTRKKKDFDEGRVVSILQASAHRVEPPCPHYGQCGGCSLQHVRAESQIEVKQQQLLDLLWRVGQTEPLALLPPLQAEAWHYRHKARLSVRWIKTKETLAIGFRERHRPGYVTLMKQCSILNAKLESLIPMIDDLIVSLDAKEFIAQIEMAEGDGRVALIIRHLIPLDEPDLKRLCDFAADQAIHLFLQPGGPQTIHLLFPLNTCELLTYTLPQQKLSLQFHPTDFTQVNVSLNRLMVNQALELLDLKPDDVVLDLFCGLGNFSLPMAQLCQQVIGVEGHESMVSRARMNAQRNGLKNTTFLCADLDKAGMMAALKVYKANKILIDPPRTGAQSCVQEIHQLAPEYLLYVSCDLATLARDTRILVHEQGYQLLKAGVMDMFPHTAHVEAMALFQKRRD